MQTTLVSLNETIIKELAHTKPIDALIELIYNSLDASATLVLLTIERNELNGVEKIVVRDNGDGIDSENIHLTFGECGYSGKRLGAQNSLGKLLHGKNGRGRFKAYSLGNKLEWLSFTEKGKIKIQGNFNNSKSFNIFSGEEILEDISRGTQFTSLLDGRKPLNLPEDKQICEELETILSGTLEDNRVSVIVNGKKLDAQQRIKSANVVNLDEPYSDVQVKTIVWKTNSESNNRLYWCNRDFQVLQEERLAPDKTKTKHSLYVAAERIEKASLAGTLNLLSLDSTLNAIKKQAKERATKYFIEVENTSVYDIIDDFKDKQLYPYQTVPRTGVEKKSKEVFDIVLVEINKRAPGIFKNRSRTETKLFLNSLKSAIENDPENVRKILQEVLHLGAEDTKELAILLDKVSMSNIIKTNKTIIDKLTFLNVLSNYLVYGKTSKYVLERSQLHKIIEKQLWIFGNQYELGASDKTIETIIALLRKQSFDDTADSLHDLSGNTQLIPDLFLYKKFAVPSSRREYNHLLIELKRPSVKIGRTELRQVQDYADAILAHSMLCKYNWDIFILSSAVKEDEIGSLVSDDRVAFNSEKIRIFVKTWKDIIDSQKWVLDEYKNSLDIEITEEFNDAYMDAHFKDIRAEIQRRECSKQSAAEQVN